MQRTEQAQPEHPMIMHRRGIALAAIRTLGDQIKAGAKEQREEAAHFAVKQDEGGEPACGIAR